MAKDVNEGGFICKFFGVIVLFIALLYVPKEVIETYTKVAKWVGFLFLLF